MKKSCLFILSVLVSTSSFLCGMEEVSLVQLSKHKDACQPAANLQQLPISKIDHAFRIQIREALRRSDLETATALIDQLLCRRRDPGLEAIAAIKAKNAGARLALIAAKSGSLLTVKLIRNQ